VIHRLEFGMGRDADFFRKVTERLSRRHVYDHTIWSYSLMHDEVTTVREYLRHHDGFVASLGGPIVSKLLTVDPVERKSYQHMEYWPLVNARAHRLGKSRQILNDRFFAQYQRFLGVLSRRPALDDDDLMSVTYYLLLQDRVEEALGRNPLATASLDGLDDHGADGLRALARRAVEIVRVAEAREARGARQPRDCLRGSCRSAQRQGRAGAGLVQAHAVPPGGKRALCGVRYRAAVRCERAGARRLRRCRAA